MVGKKGKILVVDDEHLVRWSVCRFLEGEGFITLEASSGPEALQILQSENIWLLITDLMMPVMDGIVATKKIRELEESTGMHTPIIAITANALAGDKENYLAAGMNEYISKPFQVEILVQKMKNLLENNKD